MSGCAASLEKASTAPGLVVWSSSVMSSSCFPKTPPDLLTSIQRDFCACQRISANGGRRAAERKDHADFEGIRGASNAGEHRRRKARCEPRIQGPSVQPHTLLPFT